MLAKRPRLSLKLFPVEERGWQTACGTARSVTRPDHSEAETIIMVFAYRPLETYVEKLERRAPLLEADRSALLSLPASVRCFEGQRETLIETRPTRCAFVIEGFVTREQVEGERRSIVAFGFPGYAVDLQSVLFKTVDYSVVAHRSTTLATSPKRTSSR